MYLDVIQVVLYDIKILRESDLLEHIQEDIADKGYKGE